jgi:hypothetical protein
MESVAGEGRLRTFSKFRFAHTTYVNKVLRLRALKNYMLIVPLPLARYKLYIYCPLLTTGRWKCDFEQIEACLAYLFIGPLSFLLTKTFSLFNI